MHFCVLSDVYTDAHKDRMTLTDLYMQYSEVCVSIDPWIKGDAIYNWV